MNRCFCLSISLFILSFKYGLYVYLFIQQCLLSNYYVPVELIHGFAQGTERNKAEITNWKSRRLSRKTVSRVCTLQEHPWKRWHHSEPPRASLCMSSLWAWTTSCPSWSLCCWHSECMGGWVDGCIVGEWMLPSSSAQTLWLVAMSIKTEIPCHTRLLLVWALDMSNDFRQPWRRAVGPWEEEGVGSLMSAWWNIK